MLTGGNGENRVRTIFLTFCVFRGQNFGAKSALTTEAQRHQEIPVLFSLCLRASVVKIRLRSLRYLLCKDRQPRKQSKDRFCDFCAFCGPPALDQDSLSI